MLITAPKGTRDIMPAQVHMWRYVENEFARVCEQHGFGEIRTPVFEDTEIFINAVGPDTLIIKDQIYTFKDRAKRVLALKPEGTAPVARAFVEHKQYAEVQPTRYFYNIPCFRYEKPQSGRLREFHQMGIEIFSADSMLADAEVIGLGYDFLQSLGINHDVVVHLNSLGCEKCKTAYIEDLKEYISGYLEWMCDECKERYKKNPLRLFDCRREVCSEIMKDAPCMLDYLCDECREDFRQLQDYLKDMDIPFEVDPLITRSMDFYTKTAFEFISSIPGARGNLCGGGRYNHLIESIGGPPIPGVGFGMGLERILLAMEMLEIEIEPPKKMDLFIAAVGSQTKREAVKLMKYLRDEGFRVEMDLLFRNLKAQMKYAERIGAAHTLILDPETLPEGMAAVQDMKTELQEMLHVSDLNYELREYLARPRSKA